MHFVPEKGKEEVYSNAPPYRVRQLSLKKSVAVCLCWADLSCYNVQGIVCYVTSLGCSFVIMELFLLSLNCCYSAHVNTQLSYPPLHVYFVL